MQHKVEKMSKHYVNNTRGLRDSYNLIKRDSGKSPSHRIAEKFGKLQSSFRSTLTNFGLPGACLILYFLIHFLYIAEMFWRIPVSFLYPKRSLNFGELTLLARMQSPSTVFWDVPWNQQELIVEHLNPFSKTSISKSKSEIVKNKKLITSAEYFENFPISNPSGLQPRSFPKIFQFPFHLDYIRGVFRKFFNFHSICEK